MSEENKKEVMDKLETIKKQAENSEEEEKKPEEEQKKGDKKKYKLVAEFLAKRDARIIQQYTEAVVSKFKNYVKAVFVVGSMKTGKGKKKTSDIDVPVLIDDTDVRRMTRSELKEKLFQRLVEMGYQIDKRIHPQGYLLTEFWQYVKEGNPVLLTMVRDCAIVYDTGFLLPIKMLLLKGLITPSREAVDKLMLTSDELIDLTEKTILQKLTHNLHLAAVSSSQAVLMELGYRPTTPKETPIFVEDVLFQKLGYISAEDVESCKKLVYLYKDVEHGVLKEISAKEIDPYIKSAKQYVDKMKKLLEKLRKDKGDSYLYDIFDKKEKQEMKRDGIISLKKDDSINERTEQIKKDLGSR